MFEETDDFKTVIEKYQKHYNYKPEVKEEDTKTYLLKALLAAYTYTMPGEPTGFLGFGSKAPKRFKSRIVQILTHKRTIQLHRTGKSLHTDFGFDMKNKDIHPVKNVGIVVMINTPDLHQALHEITLATGIKFEHYAGSNNGAAFFVYEVVYPPHMLPVIISEEIIEPDKKAETSTELKKLI